MHQVDHLGRQSGLEQNLDEHVTGHRHVFGGLEHARVSAHERGKHLPRGDRERKIERCDDPRHADRPAETHRPLVSQLARHGVAEHPAPFGRGIERGVDSLLHITAGFGERLPHLAGHDVGEFILARDQDLSCASHHVAACGRRCAAPELEAALRGCHGGVYVGRARMRKMADDVAGIRWIHVVEILSVRRGEPLAGDEVFQN